MSGLIVRRVLIALPILVAVSLVTFGFALLAPGDPLSTLLHVGEHARPADIEALQRQLGLDQPPWVRYLAWLGQMAQGNFGASLISDVPVQQIFVEHVPNTLLLMTLSLAISVVLGVSLGIFSAYRQHTRIDRLLTVVAFSGIAIPNYLISIVVIFVFAVLLHVLPSSGLQETVGGGDPLDIARHLVLPVAVLAFGNTAVFMRYTRASVLDVLRQDYITTARAKGLAPSVVSVRHVLRNALLPIVTIIGLTLPGLVTGALFVETIFSWPGIAKVAVDAALQRDYPVIMGVAMLTAVVIIVSSLLADVCYAFVDPRIRYS